MICRVEKTEIEEIQTTNVLPQTSYWARLKGRQGFSPEGFHLTLSGDLLNPRTQAVRKIEDDLLVLVRYLAPDQCFAYVPYGPKLEPVYEQQGVFLEELSEVIRPWLPRDCVFIRFDLLWENQWSRENEYFDASGNWIGPPETQTQEFRVNFNTKNWNLRKSPDDLLPKNTFS